MEYFISLLKWIPDIGGQNGKLGGPEALRQIYKLSDPDNLIPAIQTIFFDQNVTYLLIEVEETLRTVNVVEWCETCDFPVYVLWMDPESPA